MLAQMRSFTSHAAHIPSAVTVARAAAWRPPSRRAPACGACGVAERPAAAAPTAQLRVPNLGYACICEELRESKPPVYTNRSCVKRTFLEKGLAYVSGLALANVTDLDAIFRWNEAHAIRFFRVSSAMFPWCSEYELRDLPDYAAIAARLRAAGDTARAHGHRITSHPDHFTVLASPRAEVVESSLHALEVQGLIFDLMGLPRTPYAKINIHIGGVYGDKAAALARFEAAFWRLSEGVRSRLTIENDDGPGQYTVDDLHPLCARIGVPIVFDLHHQRFNRGAWSDREAVEAAAATWPEGVRPVVHWSESQEGRRPSAHSDFVEGPLDLYGFDTSSVDVMIESKRKERSLLRYRAACAEAPRSLDALRWSWQ